MRVNWARLTLVVLHVNGAQISLKNTMLKKTLCCLIMEKSLFMLVKVKIKVSLCPDFKKVIIDVARLSEK